MTRSNFAPWTPVLCLALVASAGQAQVYKWVDANGRTHYSEKKEDAGGAKTQELQTEPQQAAPQDASPSSQSEYWQEKEREFQRRRIAERDKAAVRPAAKMPPRSLSNGREDGSDASRCNLARDVLSGAVRHRNGAPTDANDREIAERDVQRYCR